MNNLKLCDYPHIRFCCLEIAYDNGCVNSYEPLDYVLLKCEKVLQEFTKAQVREVEQSFQSITTHELITLCNGEDTDQEAIRNKINPLCNIMLDKLCDTIFEYEPTGD